MTIRTSVFWPLNSFSSKCAQNLKWHALCINLHYNVYKKICVYILSCHRLLIYYNISFAILLSHSFSLFLYQIHSLAFFKSVKERREMRGILGNVDHRSKHALEMKMVLNGFSALVPVPHHWWIMLLMLLRTLLYRLHSRITGTRISHKKKKKKEISWIVEFWLNEPTSKLCNTDIWNNANDKTALTMISLRDEMTVPMSP